MSRGGGGGGGGGGPGGFVGGGGGGGVGGLLGILGGGVCRWVLHILTLFQPKKCNFLRLLSDQTYKIHTHYCSDPAFRPKF